MSKRKLNGLERLAIGLSLLSLADRIVKLGLINHFFTRRPPASLSSWPTVTILQTVTRGVHGLRANLEARARLDYPAPVQHILVCDAADTELRAICAETAATHPEMDLRIVCVEGDGIGPATKLRKLQAGFPLATGDVLCLMDDDTAPRPDGLRHLVSYLSEPDTGASFGLACFTNWGNVWSSMLSSYVNAYTLENFVTWAYLSRSALRVVGQMACYWRKPFEAAGAFAGLEGYIDDDFVLAKRLREAGLRPVQAPVVYDVNDPVATWREYATKFNRWIILPRVAMTPFMTPWQRAGAFLATPATILLPGVLAGVTLLARSRPATYALAATLGSFVAAQAFSYRRFMRRTMPRWGWLLLPYTVLVTPVHAVLTLLAGNEIEWRGQRLRVLPNGRFERMADESPCQAASRKVPPHAGMKPPKAHSLLPARLTPEHTASS